MVQDEIINRYKVIFLKMIHWEMTKKKEKVIDSEYYPPIEVRVTGFSYYTARVTD